MKDEIPDDICLIGRGKSGAWVATTSLKKPFIFWQFAREVDLHRLHKANTWSLCMDLKTRTFEAYRETSKLGDLLSDGAAKQLKALLPPKEIAAATAATIKKTI